jgi:outer membrane receptor protein involved in Fe transport
MPFKKTALLSSCVALAALSLSTAWAAPRRFDLPAQEAVKAIPEFGRQAGMQVVAPADRLKGVRTVAVRGELETREALALLLKGTGLEVASNDGRVIVLKAADDGTTKTAQATQPAAEPTPPTATEDTSDDDGKREKVTVVGTRIPGAKVTDPLPVTIVDEEDIDAIAPSNGDDLFRAIPQAGDVTFNEARLAGGINDARGDTASINLRGLGTGNTLMLLNGRRLVLHPAIQVENLVPVATVNTNALPVAGIRRVEVLRDGASALYGTDAVAGVINTVLRDNFDGLRLSFEGAHSHDSNMDERDLVLEYGVNFNGDRSNFSVFASGTWRDPLFASEREFSRNADMRALLVGTPFEGDTDFRNTSLDTPWAEFRRLTASLALSTTSLSLNGTTITSTSAGAATFHVQPDTNEGCLGGLSTAAPGVCFDNSVLSTVSTDENLRYNDNEARTLLGGVDRANVFTFFNHELTPRIDVFAEAGIYYSDFDSIREQETNLSTQVLIVPAENHWNPFGPVGSPNRAAVTNAPAAGLDFELQDYRIVDAGPLQINVEQYVGRALLGFRGEWAGWDWESAYVYSRAETTDTMRQPSLTLFQAALARSTPDAYNPFTGGDPFNPSAGDSTPSSAASINSFLVDIERVSHTSMGMWDLRVSKPDIFQLWGNDVAVATGIELRRETYGDDRDPRLDGTVTYTDLRGVTTGSDVMGASPTPDTSGARTVRSGFVEFAAPLVSAQNEVPFVHSLEAQVAARYEDYSFFGSITKPKGALAWRPWEWLMLRSAVSEGFRAPNLPQQFERGIIRSNTRTDWVRCEARLRKGLISNFDACGDTVSVQSVRSGSETLMPEESENFTAGVVVQPHFIPERFGNFTVTADFWQIDQTDVIGIFGDSNHVTLDYLRRVQGGENPLLIRAAPTADDIALFDGSGLAPAGQILQAIDNYRNLSPREADGYDVGIFYNLDDTSWGDFDVKLNFAKLATFFQTPGPEQQELLDAQADGTIDGTIPIVGAESLIEENGRPKWRASATVTWRHGDWGLGYYLGYVGPVNDTSALLADGTLFRVDEFLTHNFYVQYTVLGDVRVRIGARNITDEQPPIADTDTGFIGDLHSPRGRTIYAKITSRF